MTPKIAESKDFKNCGLFVLGTSRLEGEEWDRTSLLHAVKLYFECNSAGNESKGKQR